MASILAHAGLGFGGIRKLHIESREAFTELIRTKALFAYVEDCKRAVLRAGISAPDAWLSVLCAASIAFDSPLPIAERNRLGAILGEMYPALVRLDAGDGELQSNANAVADPVAVAVSMKVKNPDMPVRRIAAAVGIPASTLFKHSFYRTACDNLKQVGKGRIRRGSKSSDGGIEAEDEP